MRRVYYYEDDPLKTYESLARYEFARKFAGDKVVLDVGCGARKGPFVLSQSARFVVGSDVSFEAVSYCETQWTSPNLQYAACDAVNLSFCNEAFDIVLAFEVLEHMRDQVGFLKELYRVLKKDGICILSTPNKAVMSPGGVPQNPDHIREFTVQELKDFLSGIFSQADIYGQKSSGRVHEVLSSRKQSYQNVIRIPIVLRHILPESIRRNLFGLYVRFFSKKHKMASQEDIGIIDFQITRNIIEEADYIVALCRK